jgi:hypothetical protein
VQKPTLRNNLTVVAYRSQSLMKFTMGVFQQCFRIGLTT